MIALPVSPRVHVHPDRCKTDGTRRNHIIVIHTTEGGEGRDSAEGLARFVSGPKTSSGGYVNVASYNSVNDADSIIPLVPLAHTPFHCGGLNSAYGHCITGKAGQTPEQWADEMSGPAIELAARYTAQVAMLTGCAPRRLTRQQLAQYEPGFCGHDDIRAVFGRTTHTDPGPHFPWDRFIEIVADEMEVHVRPASEPAPDEEDDMTGAFLFRDLRYHNVFLVSPDGACPVPDISELSKRYPLIEKRHEQTLKFCMVKSGLTSGDMTAA